MKNMPVNVENERISQLDVKSKFMSKVNSLRRLTDITDLIRNNSHLDVSVFATRS